MQYKHHGDEMGPKIDREGPKLITERCMYTVCIESVSSILFCGAIGNFRSRFTLIAFSILQLSKLGRVA